MDNTLRVRGDNVARKQRKGKRKKRQKLTPEQRRARKIQRDHRKDIRSIFSNLNFARIASASDREITFLGSTSDFDDLYVFENIVVAVEYTAAQESDVSAHLKKKKAFLDKAIKTPKTFVEFLDQKFPEFRKLRNKDYSTSTLKVVVLYCSVNRIKTALKNEIPGPVYLDFQVGKYFKAVASAIKLSGQPEFFKFLRLSHRDIGENAISASVSHQEEYAGSILPEEASHFRRGYKVISFYVDPEALLERCYVLRQDRWEDKADLYQRMIIKKKIESIRKYLLEDKRVFINNIIVTLPSTTEILNPKGGAIDLSEIVRTSPIKIRLPSEYNSIGLVDGQHRVYSYYEGGANEEKIRTLRKQQNLLATGIVYPASISNAERVRFEAKLFLEINANQTNAKSDVKQAIGLILNPYSPESIAKDVVNRLNDQGPLADMFERYFFDKHKLKTTSVVSYGIRHLVNLSREDSLFETWSHSRKSRVTKERDMRLRNEYVEYCVRQINEFIGAVRDVLPNKKRWTSDKKASGILTTTNVIGFIVCLRKIVERGSVHKFPYYRKKLLNLHEFSFGEYHSSQYVRMGEALYDTYFG